MTITTFFLPDPFLLWLWKQFIRSVATLAAIGIIVFIATLAFRTIALMVEAVHEALHQIVLLCQSVNHTFAISGLLGQAVILCVALFCLGWLGYRGYQYVRGGQYESE